MEKNIVKVGVLEMEENLMYKVFVLSPNGDKRMRIDECMFQNRELAELFADACRAKGIDARVNIHDWVTLIEK